MSNDPGSIPPKPDAGWLPPAQGPAYHGAPGSSDERTWAMLAHLSPILLGFLGPLVVMLVRSKEPFIQDQAKEALNAQLSGMIYSLILAATCVGLILVPIIGVALLICSIIGAIESNKGVAYRYPYILRLVN